MPLLVPGQSCIHVLSSSMYDILTHDYLIEIYISDFHLRHLCISTPLVKATHNIKTSLIKQCYICYAWTGTNNAADTDMLLILLCCWYWYAADTVILLILLCCWYTDTAGMYALFYMLYISCMTSIFFTTVSCWNHAVAKSHSLKTKQI
jgi:hypothetical protein